ncbi:MAG: Gfo/Idh/MocA family protein [Actinomycetota bacterium]
MAEKKVGFTSMASDKTAGDIPEIGIGMLGYAFMGKAHSNGLKKMPYIFWPPPAIPKLVNICGRTKDKVAEEALRYGYSRYCTDWHELIEDEDVDVLVNVGPNNIHHEPCIEAARAGKHIVCEKPLAINSLEAKKMLDAAKGAGIKHLCNFNYRMVPALVLAKNLIADGKIGKIFHFRASYLQEWIIDKDFPLVWRLKKDVSGSGALGDLGSHIIDLARWLCSEPTAVSATTRTFIEERPLGDNPDKKGKVEVDDAFAATIEFENGAIGTLESSRFCPGRKNYQIVEINGELGSIYFELENLNYLHVYFREEEPEETVGFHAINVTEAFHPYYERWWPHGHIIGWENTFVHTAYNIVDAVINDKQLEPMVATFEDGYKNAVICDAILKSAKSEKKEKIVY